ncbi:hypothetical protein [Pseudaestuariivita atlantica]|uniref:Uncharacterized protein n=1 Tax=Pseudaestuariivita atlantica TaxID=1317121 RepID=A0A0L1JPZ7_9RHOB|nr:hypothetical protein [Pseudaestuariivita atlantica]KNG93845.1 hypothetical protein ATO11_11805 [Pseudaestuariivita atlantica]
MTDASALTDLFASRRYFRKFEEITRHLGRVAGVLHAEGNLSKDEVEVLTRYITALTFTFRALSLKYLLVGRDTGRFFGSLQIDQKESGFPVITELMTMANDASQAANHLRNAASGRQLKEQMVKKIVGDHEIPTKLQFALSQRMYYEELAKGDLFWARNDPEIVWLGGDDDRRTLLIHWAVYDSELNLPVIYLMECEDTGRESLYRDQRRWPEVQAHLMAQSLAGLKLMTIATGFDEDFDDLHPKKLRRIHLGPMYSSAYTDQSGPLSDVLRDARSPEGQDWALVWTEERLVSNDVRTERTGWFSSRELQIFKRDPFLIDEGASALDRAVILPQRPYQVLAERAPAGFGSVRKFVVSPGGRVLDYR